MNHCVQRLGLLLILCIAACVGFAAQAGLQFHISSFMTPQEMQATGVAGLSPAQRAALDQWLNRYTQLVLRAARASDSPTSGSTGQTEYIPSKGHWVDEVSSNGAIISLEDGSMWDVATLDRIDTALWLPTTDITVMRDPKPIGDYKYILVNTEDGEKAHAKYLGKH